ncbi:MAG TPA: sigma-54 dependent transcriptional regulator [Terriglobales bacterium]|nr:sigma-54 dependent transcriptional regulator [Terriglobales bacterium]
MKPRILIIDDEKLLRWSLARKLEEWGYDPAQAATCAEATEKFHSDPPDLALLDIKLPDGNGVELLRQLPKEDFSGPVIMITADPQVEDVKTALRLGAYDYLCKPVNLDELRLTIGNALEASQLRAQVANLRDQAQRGMERPEFIGKSPAARQLIEFVLRAAASPANALLLQGESGTGKDLIARILHQESPRRDGPYVPVNCSAIPENLLEAELFGHEKGAFTDAKAMKKGLFEIAAGGTIFLDEIGELPLALQSKLLRTLEDQSIRRLGGVRDIRVDVRVVAASNRNLEDEVAAGRFRQDLYYRLMVIPVFIPPLRSHKEDIPILTAFFIEQFNRRFGKHIEGVTPEAAALMESYSWPGNVRELRNAIQRAMILEDTPRIQADCLPFAPKSRLFMAAAAFPDREDQANTPGQWRRLPNGRFLPDLRIPAGGTSLEEIEKHLVIEALRQTQGNQSRAARLLDISRDTIRYAIKKHGLQDSERQDANP